MPVMTIRTKILATVGPASGSVEVLRQLVEEGCDVFRINFSHGSDEQREGFLRAIRQAEGETGEPLAICADLCGPKIRVGMMAGGGVLLPQGQEVTLQRDPIEGSANRFSTTLAELVDDVHRGEPILLDDGKLRLEVVCVDPPDEVRCRVLTGGVLGSGKGVNLPRTQLNLGALTEKDRRDVAWIARHDFDFVALSFVQRAEDVRELRSLLEGHGCGAHIIAKIEKPSAVEHFDAILAEADGVMVARGDLGVEMEYQEVPVAQKRLARAAQQAGKPCIIATQMLESMIDSPTPTRAEVSDVANAVLDHADAVMLSGETAVGKHPVGAVRVMNRTVHAVQAYHDEIYSAPPVRSDGSPTAASIAAAVRTVLDAQDIAAVCVYSATGTSARMLAKNRLPCPILALASDRKMVRRMCLYYGILARQADAPEHTRDLLALADRILQAGQIAQPGQKIVLVSGRPIGTAGQTNTLVIHTVGQRQ